MFFPQAHRPGEEAEVDFGEVTLNVQRPVGVHRPVATHAVRAVAAVYQVLAHLSEAPGDRLRQSALGGLLRWETSRLSQHLSRMEKRGLVTGER